jgi:uncharacterized protein YndB with AHSA1/START domain
MTSQAVEVEPIRHAVVVQRSVADAFALLTEHVHTWWPLATHSYGGDDAETAVFETRVGGRVFERQRDGTERVWAEVVGWEPPHRVVLAWKICEGTEVEFRVAREGDGARVEVEHRGWENVPAEVAAQYEGYAGGWKVVLGALEAAAR